MIKNAFHSDKTLFIPFIMCGHPTLEESINATLALSKAGADIIELGVPFSDPVADGPVNQHAAEIALNNGITLDLILNMVQQIRAKGCKTPIILFTYLNPILAFGYEQFAIKAKNAGVDGLLIVDLPPEEGQEFYDHLKRAKLEIILLASPTTDPKRFTLYKKTNPSFIYYISRLSVTGIQNDLSINLESEIQNLRTYFPETKIAVGFGISTTTQAAEVAKIADGVVIGSLLVKTLEEQGLESFQKLAIQMVLAVNKK